MSGSYHYHGAIRKISILFGDMFNDLYVARATTAGTLVNQRRVPIAYAPKHKFLARLQERPDLTADRVQITLPRMSYQISGALIYDSARQLQSQNACRQQTATGEWVQIYSPAPYNIPFELNIYAKNQDEGLQLVEAITPHFKPSITRKYRPIDGQSWVDEVTFVLNSVNLTDEFEGEFTDERMIIYTLSFEASFNIYGSADIPGKLIKTAIVNFRDMDGRLQLRKTTSVDPLDADPDDDYVILETTETSLFDPNTVELPSDPDSPAPTIVIHTSTVDTVRVNQTAPAASWTIIHNFGRVPIVQIFLSNGEIVDADVVATVTHVYVTFANATSGFVILA